ncbi:MAG TPA: hypothetical protein VMR25_04735 [Planctomycetaceae bacterium]|jgi:hypothetical protein|nr:hypothetical protein [Planctomycetaceae bacterium]
MNARRSVPRGGMTEPDDRLLREILGYLNFSGGKPDAAFQRNWNALFVRPGFFESDSALPDFLRSELVRLQPTVPALGDSSQAAAVIELVFDECLPAYRRHHADLLFHLSAADFRQPFFLTRMIEAVLEQGAPWSEKERIVHRVLERLNDFVGYRPLAVLENGRQMEPYPHERFRPVPVFIRDAGTAYGPYHDLVERTISFLRETPAEILRESHFDLDQMEELAVDLRAHDHAHPVTKRTNYTFGEWDPYRIDTKGRYTRFIVRKIVLDSLLSWMAEQKKLSPEERLYDASAVLSGTMLMASAISGSGPQTFDSNVNLVTLLPKVARQRDAFYERLMSTAKGARRTRLRKEAKLTQQPFGHIRQHLNIALARYGARQVQDRHVSRLYAQLGYPQAAREQSALVPAASARFETEIEWRLVSAQRGLQRGEVDEVKRLLAEVEDHLDRGIACGALADPWNILGFQGMFPLFSSREDVVPDQRIGDLIEIVENLFGVYSLALGEAAAVSDAETLSALSSAFERRAQWWDKFGASTVEDLPKVFGRESWQSAVRVANTLRAWREAGEASGDISFWRTHVEQFESVKSYALVVDVLLRRRDYVAAMGLLIQWLSSAESVGLESEGYSFHALLVRWMQGVLGAQESGTRADDCWPAVRRLFDFLEANAGSYWSVPTLAEAEGGAAQSRSKESSPESDSEEAGAFDEESSSDDDSLFEAAYEGVVYRDSTRDGREGDTLETGPARETAEVDALTRFFDPRLRFINTLAHAWLMAALRFGAAPRESATGRGNAAASGPSRDEVISGWRRKARSLSRDLSKLADELSQYELELPSGDHDENVEYDYQRHAQLYLMHTVVLTQVRLRMAERLLSACLPAGRARPEHAEAETRLIDVFRAVLLRDAGTIRRLLPPLRKQLASKPLLYVALDGGGKPGPFRQAKLLQATLRFLLSQLPRAGCLRETWQLLQTAYEMERGSRPSGMVVSEFDQLFRTALKSTLECIVRSASRWRIDRTEGNAAPGSAARGRRDAAGAPSAPIDAAAPPDHRRPWSRRLPVGRAVSGKPFRTAAWYADAVLAAGTFRTAQRASWRNNQIVTMASDVVQRYMKLWLTHSRSMRLSSVEEMAEASVWKHVRTFIEAYGADLFHAKLLTLGNVRTILDSGIEGFLDYLDDTSDELHPVKLLDDLYGGAIDSEKAMTYLEMIYESVVDKFDRYVEYNTTTTHSDYGEKFYCLLDFLRAESAYERDAWNLSPIGVCHELFSECGRHAAARAWEEDFRARSASVANKHLIRLRSLEKKYGMRLPSISDRLSEQFVKPLAVNRMRALLPGALRDARLGRATSPAFDALRGEIDDYLNTTNGSGIDVPAWLRTLEREIDRLLDDGSIAFEAVETTRLHPAATLSWNRLQMELQKWE